MKLTVGFSPCPNDTFMFDALVNGKIDTGGITFTPVIADVEELNRLAVSEALDITKLSYHAFGHLSAKYLLLDSGSALGRNCGPLVLALSDISQKIADDPGSVSIAIPGLNTTANFLFSLAYPAVKRKKEYLFSKIEDAILNGEVDAGVVIHETRFTYQNRGLHRLVDLGEYWEKTTSMPIPLGGIAINRKISSDVAARVQSLLKESIMHSFASGHDSYSSFITGHAQEMDAQVIRNHIQLYVNDFSLSLGPEGKAAVNHFLQLGAHHNLIPPQPSQIFVE